MKAKCNIVLAFEPEQLKLIDNAAKAASQNRSAFIRSCIAKAINIKIEVAPIGRPRTLGFASGCPFCGEKSTELDVKIEDRYVHELCYERAGYQMPS